MERSGGVGYDGGGIGMGWDVTWVMSVRCDMDMGMCNGVYMCVLS